MQFKLLNLEDYAWCICRYLTMSEWDNVHVVGIFLCKDIFT